MLKVKQVVSEKDKKELITMAGLLRELADVYQAVGEQGDSAIDDTTLGKIMRIGFQMEAAGNSVIH